MTVNLSRGEKANLTKDHPTLIKVLVGLGWDVNKNDDNAEFDLDVSVFLLDANDKVTSDDDFVFYGNLKHASGSVEHMGDNRTGEGEGDDEQIRIDLSKVPPDIQKIDFTVTIYKAGERQQNFGQVSNAFIRVVDETNHQELVRYDLAERFSGDTALVVGELYRNRDQFKFNLQRSGSLIGASGRRRNQREWKFEAIGQGFKGGLDALCVNYRVKAQTVLEKSPRDASR